MPLDGHIRDEDGRVVGWRMEPVPAAPKRTLITCMVCGRQKRAPSSAVQKFAVATVVANDLGWSTQTTVVPPETWICWLHKPLGGA